MLAEPATLAWCEPASTPLRVALLLSGGVDSAVALHLLRAAGHEVTAFYLKIWFEEDFENSWAACPWDADVAACTAVCAAASVPLRLVPLTRAYWDRVVTECVADLKAGRTPNPDVLCNARVKFGAFVEALEAGSIEGCSSAPGTPLGGFDRVASGHYARIDRRGGGTGPSTSPSFRLAAAADPVKDQTYFLARLSPAQLGVAMFPLGGLSKGGVRDIAAALSLPNASRPDSQGLCFLGKVKFDEFVRAHLGEWPGPLIDADEGTVVGFHGGAWFFTPGQRRGVRLAGGPWYVVAKDMGTNAVYVSRRYHNEGGVEGGDARGDGVAARRAASLSRRRAFRVRDLAWLPGAGPHVAARPLRVKVRHGPASHGCALALDGGGDGTTGSVALDALDQGLAPGQYAVFYEGGACVGAGVIESQGVWERGEGMGFAASPPPATAAAV